MRDRALDARRVAALSSLAFALLFGVGSGIWGLDMPSGGTPAAEVVDFYRETADRIVIGASLSLLAIAACSSEHQPRDPGAGGSSRR